MIGKGEGKPVKQGIAKKHRPLLGAALLLAGAALLVLSFPKPAEARKTWFAMDTYITMTAWGKQPDAALEEAAGCIRELEGLLSVTDEKSDLYAVNHSNGETVSVHRQTADLLSFALEMAEKTGGALEPTLYPVLTAWGFTTEEKRVPAEKEIAELLTLVGYDNVVLDGNSVRLLPGMMLDLGAVGKGYAGDAAARLLRERGINSALLDIGGNIQAIGAKPDGSPWRLGLRDPFSEGTLGTLEISNLAVVTSGTYERYFTGDDGTAYGHIFDPTTGYPARSGLASVTVIAPEGRLCDALSTALFVMGPEKAAEFWRKDLSFDMLLVTEDGEIILTEGIAEKFALDSYHANMTVHILSTEKS